jgi:hypothetical protein
MAILHSRSNGCYCDQRNYNPPPCLVDFEKSNDLSYQDISRFLNNLLCGVLVRVFGRLLLDLLRVFFSVALGINSQTLNASLNFVNETLEIVQIPISVSAYFSLDHLVMFPANRPTSVTVLFFLPQRG